MAVAGGIVLGIVYTLSPLTVWAAAVFAFLVWLIGDGLPEAERKRVRAILVVAILIRVVAIGGVWLTTDHARVPFAAFFGDEELLHSSRDLAAQCRARHSDPQRRSDLRLR